MRRIELIYQGPAIFMGVVTTTQDVVLPWPDDFKNKPKLCVIGDSIQIGTYLAYGGAHIGCSIAQSLGLWDGLVINGIGGTGFITGGSTAWSSPSRISDFIAHQADIYLIIGSQNDGADSQQLRDAVKLVTDEIHNNVPNSLVVGIGNVMGGSTSLSAGIAAGYASAENQNRVRYINNQSPHQWLPILAAGNWHVTNDGNHLSQEGQDYFAKVAAPYVAKSLLDMIR